MKIAVIGGTHGNEFVGIEVIKALNRLKPKISSENSYKTFLANPEAHKLKRRFVDSDLNRAFGKNSKPTGYEKSRSKELEEQIKGKFDLILDLHTTTSNMGLTAILNNTNKLTQKTCSFLKSSFPELKLIEENILDAESTHLNRLSEAGITIEFGPIANNVVSAELVIKMYELVLTVLNWNFEGEYDFSKVEKFKTLNEVYYPDNDQWFIHPKFEGSDFNKLETGDPLFINLDREVISYEGESLYPFFINEAAYQDDKVAFFLSKKI